MVHHVKVRHAAEWCVRYRDGPAKDKAAADRALLRLFDPSFDYRLVIWGKWVLTMIWNTLAADDGFVVVDRAVYLFRSGPPMKHLARPEVLGEDLPRSPPYVPKTRRGSAT